LFSAGVLLAYKGLQWYWRGSNTIYFPKQQVITIESTDSVRSVMSAINQYADKQDPLIDRSVLKFIAPEVVVKVGEYELEGYYSRAELFALFEAGKSKQYPLTLIEGETAKEFIFKIKNNPLYNTQTPSDDLSTHELIYGLLIAERICLKL